MTAYFLSDDEAVLLDGKVSDKEQAKVDEAKARIAARNPDIPVGITNLVADTLTMATERGVLSFVHLNDLTSCRVCGKIAEYARYKSGYRKGEKNINRRIKFRGIDLDTSFVRVQGYARMGCCLDCWEDVRPALAAALVGVRAELPAVLRTEGEPVYKKYGNRTCKCGWTGHEAQMRYERTMMGDGWFPSRCPECDAGGGFGNLLKSTEGYAIFDVTDPNLSDPSVKVRT